jgi:ribosomal protein L24
VRSAELDERQIRRTTYRLCRKSHTSQFLMKATGHKNSWKNKQDQKMAEEGDKIEIIVGQWKGNIGTVLEIKEWSVVVKIPMKTITVTVRDNSVRGLTKEEEAHEIWDETAEELKVLARLLAAHLNKPGKNIEMYDLFWQELKKNLGPE